MLRIVNLNRKNFLHEHFTSLMNSFYDAVFYRRFDTTILAFSLQQILIYILLFFFHVYVWKKTSNCASFLLLFLCRKKKYLSNIYSIFRWKVLKITSSILGSMKICFISNVSYQVILFSFIVRQNKQLMS